MRGLREKLEIIEAVRNFINEKGLDPNFQNRFDVDQEYEDKLIEVPKEVYKYVVV